MTNLAKATATVLTPAGRGAVAVIAVEGPDAVELVTRSFRPAGNANWADQSTGQIIYGKWGETPAEDIVVCRKSPLVIELHCHGGGAATSRILDDLIRDGAQEQNWRDRIAGPKTSSIRQAALIALAEAPTLRTAEILLDQYHGALDGALAKY